jgi:hypothetical protein
MERVKVGVTNTTAVVRTAVLYGPAVLYVRHEFPVLRPRMLGGSSHAIGLVVPAVKPHATVHVLLRFQPRARSMRLAVADTSAQKAATATIATTCHIPPKR